MGSTSCFNSRAALLVIMKIFYFLLALMVLVEVHESEGKLKKILKKVKKFAKKLAGEEEEECHIVWEEHTQPPCTTTFSEHCTTEHKNQCTTEYSTECKDEIEKVCKTTHEKVCK